jgi:glutaredoxin
MLGPMLPLLVTALVASAVLDQARADLAAGELDALLFALQPAGAVPEQEGRDAARVLLDAARLAQARGDAPLALQLAQMGLHRDPQSGPLLKWLGERSLQETELKLAVEYARRWTQAEPQSEEARQFLLRAEERERTWTPPDLERAPPRRKRAHAQRARAEQPAPPTRLDVTLYASAACKECQAAREWLTARGVEFADKDVLRDERAARELAQKRLRHRNQEKALPVVDAGGVLVQGFNVRALKAALAR